MARANETTYLGKTRKSSTQILHGYGSEGSSPRAVEDDGRDDDDHDDDDDDDNACVAFEDLVWPCPRLEELSADFEMHVLACLQEAFCHAYLRLPSSFWPPLGYVCVSLRLPVMVSIIGVPSLRHLGRLALSGDSRLNGWLMDSRCCKNHFSGLAWGPEGFSLVSIWGRLKIERKV